MSRVSRLFELVSVLRSRRLPITAFDLAKTLNVSQRSIYRDIETLRSLGAPVDGQAGIGYALGSGFFLPEFAFSSDELDALTLGLSWVLKRADPALANGAKTALGKILSAAKHDPLPGEEAPNLITAASPPERADPPQAALLRDAIRRKQKVKISYTDNDGKRSQRTIWPIAIVYFDDVRVLAAWCEHRAAFRHFRLDRLQVTVVLQVLYPGSRQLLVRRWRQQDRDGY